MQGNTGDLTANQRIRVECTGLEWLFNLLNGKDFKEEDRNRSQWTGDDQNRFESRVVDLKATERFNLLNGRDRSRLEMIRIALRAG